MFPEKHGVLKYYSPRMIVCQGNVYYEKYLKFPFGTYVLASNYPKPTNKNEPRRLDCIYLQATDSAKGVHEFLHLQTNSVVTRNRVTPAPITPTNINQVHSIIYRKGMSSEIKFASRIELVLYDSAFISGVDYS